MEPAAVRQVHDVAGCQDHTQNVSTRGGPGPDDVSAQSDRDTDGAPVTAGAATLAQEHGDHAQALGADHDTDQLVADELEAATLTALMWTAYSRAWVDILEPQDFWRGAHRDIFLAIADVAMTVGSSRPPLVLDTLHRAGRLVGEVKSTILTLTAPAGRPAGDLELPTLVVRLIDTRHRRGAYALHARIGQRIAESNADDFHDWFQQMAGREAQAHARRIDRLHRVLTISIDDNPRP